jgi:hypothetical protein
MNELIKTLRRPHTELVNIIDSSTRNHSLLTLDASTRERELALSEARRHAAQVYRRPLKHIERVPALIVTVRAGADDA